MELRIAHAVSVGLEIMETAVVRKNLIRRGISLVNQYLVNCVLPGFPHRSASFEEVVPPLVET